MTDKLLIDRSVIEQALEALEQIHSPYWHDFVTQHIDALRAALEQQQVEQEPTPNGATHRQPKQGAFYKRVDGKWYVWSRMENGESHRWYISPGTTESCLEPLYTHPQPKREPLTDEQLDALHIEGRQHWLGKRQIARAIERAHGIVGE